MKNWQKMILLSSIEFVTALYLTVFLLAVIRSAKLDFSYLGLNFSFCQEACMCASGV